MQDAASIRWCSSCLIHQVKCKGTRTGGEDAGELAGVEDGERESGALGVLGGPEVGVPVLNLVPQVVRGRQEVLRRYARRRLRTPIFACPQFAEIPQRFCVEALLPCCPLAYQTKITMLARDWSIGYCQISIVNHAGR